jgi:hypothetical protein
LGPPLELSRPYLTMEEPPDRPVKPPRCADPPQAAAAGMSGAGNAEPPRTPADAAGFTATWVRQVMEDWFRRNEMSPEDVIVREQKRWCHFLLLFLLIWSDH